MSLFKNRSGGSLFRIRSLKGFLKHLAFKGDTPKNEKTQNKMTVKYQIKSKE